MTTRPFPLFAVPLASHYPRKQNTEVQHRIRVMRMDTQSNTNNDCIDMYLMRMDTRIHEYREMSKGMICIPQSNTNND